MDIPLKDGIARVDDADAGLVGPFKWQSMRVGTNVYAYAVIAGRRVYMHHLISNRAPRGRGKSVVDHRNGDGLDNRRANLRPATNQQNSANRSPWCGRSRFMGVSWSEQGRAWQAHIAVDRHSRFLGYYEAEEDAARAYDLAAVAAFGEFARPNFPDRLSEPPPVRYMAKNTARVIPTPTVNLEPTVVSGVRSGERNNNAKLTEADVRRIIADLQAVPRRSQVSIAQRYGVSQVQVSRIAQRKCWSHLWE